MSSPFKFFHDVYDILCVMFSFFRMQRALGASKTPIETSEFSDVLRME